MIDLGLVEDGWDRGLQRGHRIKDVDQECGSEMLWSVDAIGVTP